MPRKINREISDAKSTNSATQEDNLAETTPEDIITPDETVYIGWDIGIKNLAYCLIKKYDGSPIDINTSKIISVGTNKYQILDWDVINLLEQVETNLEEAGEISGKTCIKCSYIKTSGKKEPCGKTAAYCRNTRNTDGTYYGLCNTHYKSTIKSTIKSEVDEAPELYYKVPISTCTVTSCSKKANCVAKDHKFRAYCKQHLKEMAKSGVYNDADFLMVNKSKSASTINLTLIGKSLFQELDKRPAVLSANYVLLENQPVLKNPTMKSVQMFLYSYYISRGILSHGATDEIHCYCASKKLDLIKLVDKSTSDTIISIVKKHKNNYTQNKQTAILLTENFTGIIPTLHTFFKDHKKRDDLADSMLMTLHYIERPNIERITKNEKKAAKNANRDGEYADEVGGATKKKSGKSAKKVKEIIE